MSALEDKHFWNQHVHDQSWSFDKNESGKHGRYDESPIKQVSASGLFTTAKLIEMDGWVAFRNLIKYNMEERFTAH